MSPAIFKKIADECGQYHSLIRITGSGEPFLHPQILELVEYAIKKGARVSIISNGSLVTKEKAERLLKAGIENIEFSVDAADPKTYSKIRVGLDFNKTLKNIKAFVVLRNKLKAKTTIMASIINQPDKNPNPQRTKKFWEKIVDKVLIRKWQRYGIFDTNETRKTLEGKKRYPCPYPFERLNLDLDGHFCLCPYDIGGRTNFGHINDQSIQKIWLGKIFNKYRRYHLAGKFDKLELCAQCTDYPVKSWHWNYWRSLKDARKKRK
jgi:MoaA/NifB/PqqE/SkfB family radical SAM enzyme